jgi:hypothetical protein
VSDADPRAGYLRGEAEHRAARDEARRASVRIGTVRLVTFLALVAALVLYDVWEGSAERVALALSILLGAGFVWEVHLHRRTRRGERWEEALRALCDEGILRLDRRWRELAEALPASERRRESVGSAHPYARDLDVLGDASLTRLLGPVTSERGRGTLHRWLLAPAGPEEARARQEAVRELSSRDELRCVVAAHGRIDAPEGAGTVASFLAWAEQPAWIGPGLRWAAWVLPLLSVGLGAASWFLAWPALWALPALAQVEVLRRWWRRIHAELATVEEGGLPLRAYVPQVALLEAQSWSAPYLQDLDRQLHRAGDPASRELLRLARLLDTVESRRNFVYAALAPVLLADIHLAAALDRWRGRSGKAVRAWLETLGTWEALSALATVAHDHPDWCFPRFVSEGPAVLRATALGHPLLVPATCVRNDVEVGPPGSFLLVTGSNMSGKSTLLRALGTNVVLAHAGGPVCAGSMDVPRVRVCTSMRVDDSVTEGVSLFMAELLRIRDIVQAADEGDGGAPVLFLLDEILHGTNTAERRVAARAVLRHLLARGAVGAVSTHDLTLADAPDLEAAAVPVHFREQVARGEGGRTRLTFDYLLRPGVATTRNALKLLEAVGLGGLEGLTDGETDAGASGR